jgi:hypothetical protein
MRYIKHLLFLSLAATSLASPIDTHELDVSVKEVDTPKDMHAECDMSDPQCSTLCYISHHTLTPLGAINNSGFHSVNEFEGHIGRQAGVVSNTGVRLFYAPNH